MKSASGIVKDKELKHEASNQFSKLLSSKSHSPSNTLRTINQMFDEAAKTCHFDRERALIEWLQTCVCSAVEFGLDPSSAQDKIYTEKPPMGKKTSSSERGVAQSKNKKKPFVVQDPEDEWDDEEFGYDRIGNSDDDYVPSDDEGVVPKKQTAGRKSSATKETPSSTETETKKPKPARKKKDDQVVPASKKKEASFPVIKEGAGASALHKYIQDIPCVNATSSDVLTNGYFARAFFFPSKDSFNVSDLTKKKELSA